MKKKILWFCDFVILWFCWFCLILLFCSTQFQLILVGMKQKVSFAMETICVKQKEWKWQFVVFYIQRNPSNEEYSNNSHVLFWIDVSRMEILINYIWKNHLDRKSIRVFPQFCIPNNPYNIQCGFKLMCFTQSMELRLFITYKMHSNFNLMRV